MDGNQQWTAGHIFAATFGGGAFRSTDNGDSWTQLNTGVPNATFLSLAINASGYIFAGGDPVGGPVGVIRSTDNGGTWQPVNNGLTTGNGINALTANGNGYLLPEVTATVYFVSLITATTGPRRIMD